jgi:predicted Rossmann-fold nucleotide-binding protein
MPGGIGTLDELTEVLTLIQTHKIRPFPVCLYDSSYWKGFVDWLKTDGLGRGYITNADFDLVRVYDKPEDIIEAIRSWYDRQEVIGQKVIYDE